MEELIHNITNIYTGALRRGSLNGFGLQVEKRLSWAGYQETNEGNETLVKAGGFLLRKKLHSVV